MLSKTRAKSASTRVVPNKERNLYYQEDYFKEMYNLTFKELKELNHEYSNLILLFKNLNHQKKVIEIETEKTVAQIKDKQNEFTLNCSKLNETEEEILVIQEKIYKEKKEVNKKKEELKRLHKIELAKANNKDECYSIKKQGQEIVEKQKSHNKDLEELLFRLEQELSYLQIELKNRQTQEEKLYYQTVRNINLVNYYIK